MSKSEITSILKLWVFAHQAPDEPALLTGAGLFSPRQILQAVKEETPLGLLFVRMMGDAPVEEILERLSQRAD